MTLRKGIGPYRPAEHGSVTYADAKVCGALMPSSCVHYLILNDDASLRIIGGPYPTRAARDRALPALIRRYPGLDAHGSDSAYWLRVSPQAVTIGQFTGGFMDVMRKQARGTRLSASDRRWLSADGKSRRA